MPFPWAGLMMSSMGDHEGLAGGFLLRRRLLRAYRSGMNDMGPRVAQDIALIGHPEYPRQATVEDLVASVDGLLRLNQRLAARGHLPQTTAQVDVQLLLALRRRARAAADQG